MTQGKVELYSRFKLYPSRNRRAPSEDCNRDVSTLCKEGRLKEAVDVLLAMDQRGVRMYTYGCLLQGCINMKALVEGKRVHTHIIKSGLEQDIFLGSTLVRLYAKCGSVVDARQVFDRMRTPNLLLWNVMIAGYAEHGHAEEAFKLFQEMQQRHVKPDKFTITSILKICASLAALEEGKWVHAHIMKTGIEPDLFLEAALVNMYAKCGCIDDARQVFNNMAKRDVVTWTALIAAYAQHGHGEEALELFQQMRLEGVKPNMVSWNAMLTGYARHGHSDQVLKLFRQMQREGMTPNVVSWTALIAGHAQHGHIEKALELFQLMRQQGVKADVVSWNAMITGCTQNGRSEEALKLFWQMQQQGMRPDNVTFTIIFNACATLAALEQGKEVHANMIRTGPEVDFSVENVLIDMYAKCGSIEDACQVFENMRKRDVISWTVMIVGYAMNGYGKEALQLFEQMLWEGMTPDHITFIGVLSACSHAGLVKEGHHYFDSMSRSHGIVPIKEHYTCMVDLLGRVGHLNEAWDFMSKMPFQPDAVVWRTLLGACRSHGNVMLAECAAERALKLEPENLTPYVLLSNVYAISGRWDALANVRNMMQVGSVKRRPGCSWIEVNNRVHAFVAGDTLNLQMEEISVVLDSLAGQMEEAGYVTDTCFMLHDVGGPEQQHSICGHSEKLAIAFGLISIPPGTPIRIFKNLQMCGDCHIAINLISKVVRREIVVKDVSCFHRFKDGVCSCGDYW